MSRHWLRWNDSDGRFHAIHITSGSYHVGELVSVLMQTSARYIEVEDADAAAPPKQVAADEEAPAEIRDQQAREETA